MLNNPIFYHGITRKTIVAFGSLFSDIKITRENDDGSVAQTIAVPISYAPKEKWLVRIEQDSTLENHTYTTLPRMSFEITGFRYDANRKISRMNYVTCPAVDGSMNRTYAPVPYNIDINLYILTKTTEDGLQIVEQILPFFNPELTMQIKSVDDTGINNDVPVILNSLDVNDEYDGDFSQRRFVTYTMSFTLKTNMYGPVINNNTIQSVNINVGGLASLQSFGDTTDGSIGSLWTES